jgi:hypothetical protein
MRPTNNPTMNPVKSATNTPTKRPTMRPTNNPTMNPTMSPAMGPTMSPTKQPTMRPTKSPTQSPVAICNVLVEEFDFETPGQNTKWSNSKTETAANFTTFLGRFTQGASTNYTFKNIPRDRKKLVFEFDLFEIDDWEAGQAGQQYADVLYITLNAGTSGAMEIPIGSYNKEFDEKYFEDWFADVKYTSRSYAPPTNLGFGVDVDQRHKVVIEIPNRFIRSDNSLNVGFKFVTTAADEFAGFDNIRLSATCDEPGRAPTSAPTKPEQKRIIPNSCTPGSWGDPHIRPWNCQQYDFFGKCDVMVRAVQKTLGT